MEFRGLTTKTARTKQIEGFSKSLGTIADDLENMIEDLLREELRARAGGTP